MILMFFQSFIHQNFMKKKLNDHRRTSVLKLLIVSYLKKTMLICRRVLEINLLTISYKKSWSTIFYLHLSIKPGLYPQSLTLWPGAPCELFKCFLQYCHRFCYKCCDVIEPTCTKLTQKDQNKFKEIKWSIPSLIEGTKPKSSSTERKKKVIKYKMTIVLDKKSPW